jgi:flagellar assembly factor FliW
MGIRAARFLSLLLLGRRALRKLIGSLKTGCRRPTMETVMTLTLNSSRFGSIQVAQEALIDFPSGLIGLPSGRYALVTRSDNAAFRWLQSVDDSGLALPVADPMQFFAHYAVDLSDHDAARIELSESDVPAVYVTIRVAGGGESFTANLRAPVLVASGRGYQVINQIPGTALRAPLPRDPGSRVRCVPCSSSPGAPARRSCSAMTS